MKDKYDDGTRIVRGAYDALMGRGIEFSRPLSTQEVFQTSMAKRERCRERIKTHGQITVNDLVTLNACEEQREMFWSHFGTEPVTINLVTLREAKRIGLDIHWLVGELIPDRYYTDYTNAISALAVEYYADRNRIYRRPNTAIPVARQALKDLKADYSERQVQLVYLFLKGVIITLE